MLSRHLKFERIRHMGQMGKPYYDIVDNDVLKEGYPATLNLFETVMIEMKMNNDVPRQVQQC